MVVLFEVPLPAIVIAGHIAEMRPIRLLLDRVNVYRSYIGSRRSRYSRLLLAVLIAVVAIEGMSPVIFLLLLLYV